MITVAVQIQLSHSQSPKWRPSSTFNEVTEKRSKSNGGGRGVKGEGGDLVSAPLPVQAMRAQEASGYTAADTIPCYQSNVSFLPFHLSLYRSGWTVVDKNAHTIGARQLHTLYLNSGPLHKQQLFCHWTTKARYQMFPQINISSIQNCHSCRSLTG
jgi:hypothetical protein